MDDKKKISRLIVSIMLIAFSIFALASFFTHSPNDPPFGNYPLNDPIKNCCGKFGADLSGYMLLGIGVTSLIPFLFMGTFGTMFMIKNEINHLWTKSAGAMMFIACLAPIVYILSSFLKNDFIKPELAGIFGLISAVKLTKLFGILGTCILLSAGFLISLILITDAKIIKVFSMFFTKSKTVAAPLSEPVSRHEKRPFRLFSIFKNIHLPKLNFKGICPDFILKKKTNFESQTGTIVPAFDEQQPIVDNVFESKVSPNDVKIKEIDKSAEILKHMEEEVKKENDALSDSEAKEEYQSAYAEPAAVDAPILVKIARNEVKNEPATYKDYTFPTIDLLADPEPLVKADGKDQLMERASVLQLTLKQFNVDVRVVEIEQGPVITMFELELAPGVKVSKVVALSDDLAIALKSPSVRVVAPLPKKSSVGLEVPNSNRQVVRLKEVIAAGSSFLKKQTIPLVIGKDVSGNPLITDMTTMPHLLIAGTTGSGKSVCLNTIILSVLCFQRPDQVKLLLVDPKMVEFSPYNDVPHLISPIVTDMKKAAAVLEWAVNKMEERYSLLSRVGVRNIDGYNKLGEKEIKKRLNPYGDADIDDVPFNLPFIIIIVDELADLMMVAAKEVEGSVIRLSQKSRAVGIHLILATQRPSVNVVTGLIKSNMPSRISFFVPTKVDSRTILDQNGAEKLLGSGDLLFLPPGTSKLVRSQGAFVDDEEVRNVVEYLKARAKPEYSPELKNFNAMSGKNFSEEDELYDQAVRITLETQRGSVSLIQRRLGVGYSRAAKLIDLMAEDGLIGEYKGSQAREVLVTLENWEKMRFEQDDF